MNLEELVKEAGEVAEAHGFHEEWNDSEKIALMHSELSELLEAQRETKPGTINISEKIPAFTKQEEELADLFIRAADYAGYNELAIEGAIVAKMAYNRNRPYKHGKVF